MSLRAHGRPRAPVPRDEQGSATAEFAVVLPAVVLVIALTIGGLAAAGRQVRLEHGAAQAVRLAARGESDARVGAIVATIAGGSVDSVSRDGAPALDREAEDQPWPGLVHWGPSRTRFRIRDDGGSETILTFSRTGIFAWKLSHIGLPDGGSPAGAGEASEDPPPAG